MTRENTIVSVNPDGIDTFREKAIRHLIDVFHGTIEWQTIRRGIKLVFDEGLTSNIDSSVINKTDIIYNAFGINDLRLTTFHVEMPVASHINNLKRNERVQFVDFPLTSSLEIDLHDQQRIPTNRIFYTDDNIIATFTGPTSSNEADYPNNGFYYKGRLYKPFEQAKSRKGALAILDTGEVILKDDNGKRKIVENQFAGITTLVGTSFYITDKDFTDNADIMRYNGRSRISYLLQYILPDGSARTVFVLATMGTRRKMKEWIDEYCSHIGIRSYIAVELERDRAGCFIKQGDKIVSLIGGGFNPKPEHYVFKRGRNL